VLGYIVWLQKENRTTIVQPIVHVGPYLTNKDSTEKLFFPLASSVFLFLNFNFLVFISHYAL
jgi:hypothetical protein